MLLKKVLVLEGVWWAAWFGLYPKQKSERSYPLGMLVDQQLR
jgi:hypothetical protein